MVRVGETTVRGLSERINLICRDAGFPEDTAFKWSPGRELWMYDSLVGAARQQFLKKVLQAALEFQVDAAVVIEDTDCRTATGARSHEEDVVRFYWSVYSYAFAAQERLGWW
jgi:hypothetical protein